MTQKTLCIKIKTKITKEKYYMKVIESSFENGSLTARLMIDKRDIDEFSTQQKAVEYFIMYHAKSLRIDSLLFTRVNMMDEHEDGSIELRFEAAASPEVKLGQYRGVPVDIGHCEDYEEAAVTAAANNMTVELPLLIVERKLETIRLEKETELLQSVSLNALADVYAILKELEGGQDDEARWSDAMEISESYLNMGMQDVGYFAECIGDVCFEADNDEILRAIERRAELRGKLPPEAVGEQVFQAYLKSVDTSYEDWKKENIREAERQCRVDFLLSAVADAENITASDTELDKAAYDLAVQYQMSDKDVLAIVGEEALRHQIKMAKARKIIAESAKNI